MNDTNGISRDKLINWLEDRARHWRAETNRLLLEAEKIHTWIVSSCDPAGDGAKWADLKADADLACWFVLVLSEEADRLKGEK